MFPVGPCQYADVVAFLLETATEKLGAFPLVFLHCAALKPSLIRGDLV